MRIRFLLAIVLSLSAPPLIDAGAQTQPANTVRALLASGDFPALSIRRSISGCSEFGCLRQSRGRIRGQMQSFVSFRLR
jgi:hypothetical protein